VLPFPEVLVPSSSSPSQQQLNLQIPPGIQPLITPHTFFLLNKSDLVTHNLPSALSTTSSFSVSHLSVPSNAQSYQVNKPLLTTHIQLIPTSTSPIEAQNVNVSRSPHHSQAWSTSLVTNQGTHEFLQGLAEALKSQYVIHFLPRLLIFFLDVTCFFFTRNNFPLISSLCSSQLCPRFFVQFFVNFFSDKTHFVQFQHQRPNYKQSACSTHNACKTSCAPRIGM
jgi:hypothetical protein